VVGGDAFGFALPGVSLFVVQGRFHHSHSLNRFATG
jgi:hypothetical protein